MRIYLDNNAATPLDPLVIEEVLSAMKEYPANSSSSHSLGRLSKKALLQARARLARLLKVQDSEIIFTSGGTEGMNMLIQGILGESHGHIISSDVEHSAVYSTLKNYSDVTFLKTGRYGAVKPEALEAALKLETRLIVLMAVNNETGVKTDIEGIAKIAERRGIPFIVDGVALAGKERVELPRGVSAAAFAAHKFHGPRGAGFVFIRNGLKLKPLLIGGDQEFSKRAGTENLPGILGLVRAFELAESERPYAEERMRSLRQTFELELMRLSKNVEINGEGERICNTSNLSFNGIDGESLLMHLDQEGIAVSLGSACASGALQPSRVLINMGYQLNRARSSIRFSFSRFTNLEEVEETIRVLSKHI